MAKLFHVITGNWTANCTIVNVLSLPSETGPAANLGKKTKKFLLNFSSFFFLRNRNILDVDDK